MYIIDMKDTHKAFLNRKDSCRTTNITSSHLYFMKCPYSCMVANICICVWKKNSGKNHNKYYERWKWSRLHVGRGGAWTSLRLASLQGADPWGLALTFPNALIALPPNNTHTHTHQDRLMGEEECAAVGSYQRGKWNPGENFAIRDQEIVPMLSRHTGSKGWWRWGSGFSQVSQSRRERAQNIRVGCGGWGPGLGPQVGLWKLLAGEGLPDGVTQPPEAWQNLKMSQVFIHISLPRPPIQ